MARIHDNLVLHGISGMIGRQLVMRRYRGGYVLAAAPAPTDGRRATPHQRDQRERFHKAALYAKATQGRPEYQALAKDRGTTGYLVAMRDFLRPPEIERIDVSGYTGLPGETIAVTAVDDVKVQSVHVQLRAPGGHVFEQGEAVVSPRDPHHWVYIAVAKAPSSPVQISVDAADLAGHTASRAAHT